PPGQAIAGTTEEQFADVAQRAASGAEQLIAKVNRGLNPGELAADIHHTLLAAANPAAAGRRLDTLSANLAQLTGRLADATGSLKTLLDRMENGEGTLGKFASDTLLYANLNATLKSLTELLTDLRERPGRYLTVKVF